MASISIIKEIIQDNRKVSRRNDIICNNNLYSSISIRVVETKKNTRVKKYESYIDFTRHS